ncbi:hypothetical protein EYR38_001879 [Pleurotus pulmonarius]|nr:hypothetical protein EYR38_001879 [Pleurotus pulmonarius]
MAWSTPYVEDILKPAIVEWYKKKSEGREEVIKQTCKELYVKQAANPTKLASLKEAAGLAAQVAWWFKNNQKRYCKDLEEDAGASNERSKAGKGMKGKSKAVEATDEEQEDTEEPAPNVDVPWHKRMTGPLMAKACDEEAFKEVLARHEDKGFGQRFNLAINEYWAGFTEEEKDDFSKKAREWNRQGPPKNMKPSLAKRSMQESMNSVVEYFAKYYGASVIMFSMAPGDDDSPIIRWHETKDGKRPSKFIKPNVFRAFQEEWVESVPAGLYGDAVKSKDTDPERDSWAVVEESEDGIPMLPNLPAGARSEAIVRVFREYGNLVADMDSDGKVKRLPWLRLSQDNEAYIYPKSLISGVHFGEPTKMPIADVRQYYMHFLRRQDKGTMGLRLREGWDTLSKESEVEKGEGKRRRSSVVEVGTSKRIKTPSDARMDVDGDVDGEGSEMDVDENSPGKDVPVGMLAPSQISNKDHIVFLRSLSTNGDYQAMISWLSQCKQGQVSMRSNRRPPTWGSWSLKTPHLPMEFYLQSNSNKERENFAAAKAYLLQEPLPHVGLGDVVGPYERVETTILIVGLMLRDMAKVCFLEPGGDEAQSLPEYMQDSSFAIKEWEELGEVCSKIRNSLRKWEEDQIKRAQAKNAGPKAKDAGPKAKDAGPKAKDAGPKAKDVGPKAKDDAGPKAKVELKRNWIGKASRIPKDLLTLASSCGLLREDAHIFQSFGADWKAVADNYWALETALLGKAVDGDGVPHHVEGLPTAVDAWVNAWQEEGLFDVDGLIGDAKFGEDMWKWWKKQKDADKEVCEEKGLDGLLEQPHLQRGGRGLLVMLWAVNVWGKGVVRRQKPQGAEAQQCVTVCKELRLLFIELLKAPAL